MFRDAWVSLSKSRGYSTYRWLSYIHFGYIAAFILELSFGRILRGSAQHLRLLSLMDVAIIVITIFIVYVASFFL